MTSVVGKYTFEKADEHALESYLKSLGVGLVLRKVLLTSRPTLEITRSLDEWVIKTETPFKTSVCRLKADCPVEDETFDARKCFTHGELLTNERIVLIQKCEDGPDVKIVQEKLDGSTLRVSMTSGRLSAVQFFKKAT